jgi:hypothetical protein
MRKVIVTLAASKRPSKEQLKAELKLAIADHKKILAKLKKANVNITLENEPEIGWTDSGYDAVLSGEIVVRGKTASYSINTPEVNSVAKLTKKTSWVFDVFKGQPLACLKFIIEAVTADGGVTKVDSNLLSAEKGILKALSNAADAYVRATNVARLTYRTKSQGGKILWIAVQAPSDMTDMEGGAIREDDAKKVGVTLQQILDYLVAKDARKPKPQKRSPFRGCMYD